MEYVLKFVIFQLFLNSQFARGQGSSNINFIGPSTVQQGKDDLFLTCSLGFVPAEADTINEFHLYKNKSREYKEILRVVFLFSQAENNYTKITWFDADMEARASATGSAIYPTTDAKLNLIIRAESVLCADAGAYKCQVTGFVNGNMFDESEISTVEVLGRNKIEITLPKQDVCKTYKPGEVLDMHCNGSFSNATTHLTWLYKHSSYDVYTKVPSQHDVIDSGPVKDGCQYQTEAVLRYNITMESEHLTFICAIDWNGTCIDNENVFDTLTVFVSVITAG